MAKTPPPLTAQERVILFCTATGVSHAAVGITAHAMQSMAIKGFIVHDRESGAYALTDALCSLRSSGMRGWHRPGREPEQSYEPTCGAAMAAFAKIWRLALLWKWTSLLT